MSSELFKKFSEELKTARENKSITLQQISNKTKINVKFLEAMELGDFSVIDEVYIRAFLSEYAQMIDLGTSEVLKRYDLCKAGKVENADMIPQKFEKEISSESERQKQKEFTSEKEKVDDLITDKPGAVKNDSPNVIKEKNKQVKETTQKKAPDQNAPLFEKTPNFLKRWKQLKSNTAVVASVVGGIIVLFIIIYYAFIKEWKPEIVSERPYEEVVKEQTQKWETKSKVTAEKEAVNLDSLTLVISASDTSWVRVVMDASRVAEFILKPNLKKELKAGKDFNILIGNSGGIGLFLNGKNLDFIGRRGGVRNIIVDKIGYRPVTTSESSQNE